MISYFRRIYTFQQRTEFWKMLEKNAILSDIFKKIKERYEFEV